MKFELPPTDTIYITGIPHGSNEEAIAAHFGSIGILKVDKKTKKPKVGTVGGFPAHACMRLQLGSRHDCEDGHSRWFPPVQQLCPCMHARALVCSRHGTEWPPLNSI